MEEGAASVGRPLEALTRLALIGACAVVVAACPVVKVNEACNADDECSAGLRCVAGECGAAPAPPKPCAAGTHDGGDGKCVAAGTCSAGFDRFFVDEDGDGHGAGPKSDACMPSSSGTPPPGFSNDDSDCDDGDVHGFRLDSFPFDDDNDGFSARVSICGDGTRPRGALAADAFAPTPTSGPSAVTTDASNGGTSWSGLGNLLAKDGALAQAVPNPNPNGIPEPTQTLRLSGFSCGIVPSTLQGVRVRIAASFLEEFTTTATHVTATIGSETTSVDVAVPFSQQPVPQQVDIALGGPGFAASLDPAALCAGTATIDVGFAVSSSGGGLFTLGVDTVTLDLFGVDDCDDADATKFSPAELYGDGDNDGFFGGTPASACLGVDGVPAGKSVLSRDCDDSDANVHPGQTSFFTTASNGGIFDYDCNGMDEAQPIHTDTSCTDDGNGGCATGPPSTTTGTCGAVVDVETCGGPPCALSTGQATQACR